MEQLGGLPFPLLSDYWPHGAVGKAYGVFNEERGMDARSAFVLDAQGVIRYAQVYAPGTIQIGRASCRERVCYAV